MRQRTPIRVRHGTTKRRAQRGGLAPSRAQLHVVVTGVAGVTPQDHTMVAGRYARRGERANVLATTTRRTT